MGKKLLRQMFVATSLLIAISAPQFVFAETMAPTPTVSPTPSADQRLSVHGQITNTQQYHGGFKAAYSGPQSLSNQPDTAKTFDATVFIGARIGKATELYVNPEIDQGFGLGSPANAMSQYNGTFGAAGFVSGEAYKVGRDKPYMRVQRFFVRQTFNQGGNIQKIDPDINQLGESVRARHITVTAGKFAVTDVFDTNTYAHDPKNDFLNWTMIDMGAFDYAADAWGYTDGATVEQYTDHTTLRAGVFQLSAIPNDIPIEHTPLRQYSPVVEFERRTAFFGGHPGAFKALVYADDGYFGSYADAMSFAGNNTPNTANVRNAKHFKIGEGINIAQEVANHVGVFTRLSAMNGTWETDEFTDVDRSLSMGFSIDGGLYHRPHDTFALGYVDNGISQSAQKYFATGGLGILVGDGNLSYGDEHVLESYYKIGVGSTAAITCDYQRLTNPAYNSVRGPVNVIGLRYHIQK